MSGTIEYSGQKRIVILGSSGQVGAYLTDYLRNKGHDVWEFDIVNGEHQDMTTIPNPELQRHIMCADFIFFLAFDVGGSRYLKKYQHTFEFINNNTRLMANAFTLIEKYKKPFVFASSQMSNMSYSPYGVLKRVGELYTKALNGLTVKFWNVYGIEHDEEKSHVITDFLRKAFDGLENGGWSTVEMLTDGTEERQFLYAEDCCEALETVMDKYDEFGREDPLHITSFNYSTVSEVASIITEIFHDEGKGVTFVAANSKDEVQKDKRNEADPYICQWWKPKTNLKDGIMKVYRDMKESRS
jgi:nucleoside-diphosphate-sugar epimerase